jgi:heme-degrading monooxygenase HmoA
MNDTPDGILEIAEIDVVAGSEEAFERAVAEAAHHFQSSPGCRSLSLLRSEEFPSRYRLHIIWDSIEAHTEQFRNSEAFQAWRTLASPHFASPPQVEHARVVLKAF